MLYRFRPPAGPGWPERKHRQTVAQASQLLWGMDLSSQLYPEIRHRAERTSSPGKGPQQLYEAEAKVLRDWARKRPTDSDARARLEGWIRSYRRARRL